MPCTFSMVEPSMKSGAISTKPPMATTIRMPTRRTIECFSKISCFMASSLGRRGNGARAQLRRGGDTGLILDVEEGVATHGLPDVPGHEQRAKDEQGAAHGADDVGPVHGLDRLGEGVCEEAQV